MNHAYRIVWNTQVNKLLTTLALLLSAIALTGCVTTNPREASCKTLDAFNGKYDGGCRNGLAHGNGTYTFSDRSFYVGDFVDGYRTGQGALTLSNGKVLSGRFNRGNFKWEEMNSSSQTRPSSVVPSVNNAATNEQKRPVSRSISALVAADPKKVAEMAEGFRAKSAGFEPIDKAAYYLVQRESLNKRIAVFNEVVAALPSVEQRSVASGPTKFPDIRDVVTKEDFVQKFLHNASDLAVIDRPAYFQLLQLNISSTTANFTQLVNVADGVLKEFSPDVIAKAQTAIQTNATIDGLLVSYNKAGDQQALKRAYDLATTGEQKRLVEGAIVESVDPNRLVSFSISIIPKTTEDREGSCLMLCLYNFSATREISVKLKAGPQASGSPIKLRYGTYRVSFDSALIVPTNLVRYSNVVGNESSDKDVQQDKTVTVTLSPPDYKAEVPVNLGSAEVAFLERGSAGGVSYRMANGKATARVQIKSVEFVK